MLAARTLHICRTICLKCVTYLPPTAEEVNAIVRNVCLSVCLLARLLRKVCMDLDDILHVDRCLDMDELINF